MLSIPKKNRFTLGAIIFIIILLLFSGVYYAVVYFGEEESKDSSEEDQFPDIDDQISPGLNQALLVEINRIRHRGIVDAMLQRGRSWQSPPSFYYSCTRDGNTFISKDESAAGGASSEQLFNTWDTMFKENRMQEDIEEEQETVDVTIKIIERVNTGLLGLQSNDVEKEEIQVTYDFRTGRWSGDDFFLDDDGYGHYVGTNFEVWFNIYQTDYDGDYIPYWTEVNVLHTDPMVDDSELDPDEDGIPTDWEWKWGYDPHCWDDHKNLDPDIDGLQNIEEYQMRKYFADPFIQDIYIEVDGMQQNSFIDKAHVFYEECEQLMIERFAQHGINMYFDNGWPDGPVNRGGELLEHYETISQESGVMLQFYRHNFADERKGIFRYLIVGHNAGFCIPSTLNRYDTMVIDSSPYKVYLRRFAFTPRTQRLVLTAAAMHELGHSLGIAPWTFQGCDNLTFAAGRAAKQEYADTWGDYYSVMNYYHIWDKTLVDYSDGSNGPPYDQDDWAYFYLPTFEIESNAVEDPIIEPPGTERLINETVEPVSSDAWKLDENITDANRILLDDLTNIPNMDVEYRVYLFDDEEVLNGMQPLVNIYARPDVDPTYAEWSLVAEGTLTADNTIEIYDQQEKIDEIYP